MHGRDVYSECSIIIAGTKDIDECASAATLIARRTHNA